MHEMGERQIGARGCRELMLGEQAQRKTAACSSRRAAPRGPRPASGSSPVVAAQEQRVGGVAEAQGARRGIDTVEPPVERQPEAVVRARAGQAQLEIGLAIRQRDACRAVEASRG